MSRFSPLCVVLSLLASTPLLVNAQSKESPKKATSGKATTGNAVASKKPAEFAWVNPVPGKYSNVVQHGTFESEIAGEPVGYCVLLPPGYEANANESKRYPVVYYLHGGRPGGETKALGVAPMMREAMSSGRVPEMIIVFVNGGPVSHYNVPGRDDVRGKDVFVEELIPHIDATYRTIADREHRGLEGFSQGGRGTARIGFRHPELFCSIAAGGGGHETERRISESGGMENPNLVFAEGDNTYDLARAYAASEPRIPMKVLIYVGTKDFNYENNLVYMKFLDGLRIPHERIVTEGIPHSASGNYEKRGEEIMRFHARNFGLMGEG